MVFDPGTDRYPYPDDTAEHYLIVKKNNGAVFDDAYPYVDSSPKMRVLQALTRAALRAFVFPAARVRLGLRVRGRSNLKRFREELKNGAVTCSNHVHMWDFIAVLYALRPQKPFVPVWPKNVRGENGALIRLVRGVPVPDTGAHATSVFNRSIGKELEKGGWLHVYAEGSMWEYYAPIRPFLSGTAYYACRYGLPLVPMAFSYRRPGWIRRKIFRQIALFTLSVGEPLFPDSRLSREERREDLIDRSHRAVCALAGIDPDSNPYPAHYDRSRKTAYVSLKGLDSR